MYNCICFDLINVDTSVTTILQITSVITVHSLHLQPPALVSKAVTVLIVITKICLIFNLV